jgi:predicted ATP-dependent endonuclease of OLD family
MKLTKIKIENFKSIKEIEFDIKKYGNSYTTMFVGINESGKSNLLEAMSYFDTPEEEFDYNILHNQKDEDNNPVDLWFSLEFEQKQTCLNELKKDIENGDFLYFEIENIMKNVYLEHDENSFADDFSFDIKKLTRNLFIKKTQKNTTNKQGQQITVDSFVLSKENDDEESFQELTTELFEEYFSEKIKNIIRRYSPSVSFWRPSDKYLVSEVDLNEFKDNIDSNIPLKHIFYIAGFTDKNSIATEIEKISNHSLRRKLAGTLGDKVTKYVKDIWKHNIIIDIEIAESGLCVVSVRDGGKDNEFNYHKMTVRSEGFKQFMSLILSLSVETKMANRKNNLILIDEPEAHLHPSGIRDLRNELLEIGKNNYLFISTHSPFLVDRKNKERNVIIRKNKSAFTEKIEIDKNTDIIDDEVLREAFGIEVYKDLLNPHSILVEGASDKKILQKAFAIKGLDKYGITNGHGSNIDTLASKLNDTDISILVILDDDTEGKEYKEKILKIAGSYSSENVVTIRDLVGDIIDNGTIEDTLGVNFIKGKTCEVYKKTFSEECDISLSDKQPFVEQIRTYLHQKKKSRKIIDKFLEDLKIQIANDFKPAKSSFVSNFPLLDSLVNKIQSKLEQE